MFRDLVAFCKDTYQNKCYVANRVILLNADCYDAVDALSSEFGRFASCWINDPPYGTTLNEWDKVIPADDYWDFVEATTVPTSPLLVFGSQPFTSALVMSADRWHRYCLVWDKNKCGSPGLAKYRPMKVHEDVAVFSRKTHPYYPQLVEGEPYFRKHIGRKGPNNHKYGFKYRGEMRNEGTRYPTSILRFPRNFSAQQQLHPTQKPVPLLKWMLQSYTQKSDITIDITAGVCSTGIAAFELGRMCICIEKKPLYYRAGRAWVHALRKGLHWDPAQYRKQFMQ